MADIKISQLPLATAVNNGDVFVINQSGDTKQVAVSTDASSIVLRDSNKNITANSIIEGFSSIAASGTQVTLTAASVPSYLVTGSGGQVIQLPNATTLANGVVYLFNNNQSSGAIDVNNNSGTLVASIPSGGFTAVTLLSNAAAAGTWERHEQAPSNVTWSTNTLNYVGSITGATWNGNAVAVLRGGTGQSTYTDGQLLIGNTTGNTLDKANLTAGDGITITNGAGSISIAQSTATQTNVQVFTSSDTWTKPAGAKQVVIELCSGGNGGGAGGKGTSGTAIYGGSGGGGGGYSRTLISAIDLTESTYTVIVGAGGAGAIFGGTNATQGGVSGFSLGSNPSVFFARAASGGTPGQNGGTTLPTSGTGGSPNTNAGGPPSISSNAGAGAGGANAPTGGGAGGGISAGNIPYNGGSGATNQILNIASAGGTQSSSANGGNGATSTPRSALSLVINGNGGGGGGASTFATGSGGNGGNGSGYGSGGGGGGATIGSGVGGNGGNGAPGIVVVTTYF